MKLRVLLHVAALLAVLAAANVFIRRTPANGDLGTLLIWRYFPLAAIVTFSVLLLELSRSRLGGPLLFFPLIAAALFLGSSFFLPFKNHSGELAAIPAYVSILILLSCALAAAIYSHPTITKVTAFAIIIGGVGLVAGMVNTFSQPDRFKGSPPADVAVVLGGSVWGPHTPSPDLKKRLDTAADLYLTGEVRCIAVTGGTRRFNTYESEIGAWYLRELGIPASRILTEHSTLNTIEQVRYVKDVLVDSLGMTKVVLVSDGWHLPRTMLMCRWENLRATCYPSHYRMSLRSELYWRAREAAGLEIYFLFGG